MRWLSLVVLAGCGFPHGSLSSGDGSTGDDDDGSMGSDGTMPNSARVRAIDLTDAEVIGGPHASFPLLVSLSATWLRATSSGGDVASADGFDIYFSSDTLGTTRLDHEVEQYAPTTGDLVAWVRVPSLESSTVIYLHYGNSTLTTNPQNVAAVWSAGFEGVFHLGAATDSTGKNPSTTATTTGTVAGRIDMARSFDGTDDVIDMASAAAIDNLFSGGGTAEGWFYADTWGEASHGRIFDKGHDNGWSLWVDNVEVSGSVGFLHGSGGASWGFWSSPAQSVALDEWHHVAVVYDKASSLTNAQIYLDGRPVTTTEIDEPSGLMDDDAAITLCSGNRVATDRAFEGLLDELRLSSVARSAGWIETSVRNQATPSAFYSVSAPL